MNNYCNYGEAIRQGFQYLLSEHENVFTIGQGLWSPWYVGNSMRDLEQEFGKERVLDTPVSEQACTGMAVGASLCGYRPVVIHPRIDFMILAVDQIVNQAAKWRHMLGGKGNNAALTIRGIVNRGGEQGAQHSQSLHSWFAHIPGLRVVMPATVQDARDLLIASVLCDDPVIYIDDRWLYDDEDTITEVSKVSLDNITPEIRRTGHDITMVASSYSVKQCIQAAKKLAQSNVQAEVIDLRVINPIDTDLIMKSVEKTRCLLVVDGGWSPCGLAGEIIASVSESMGISRYLTSRMTIPFAPAPTSRKLEAMYYINVQSIVERAMDLTKTIKQ